MPAKKALVVFGTRPEAIKMAPVVKALQACAEIEVQVCVTAQHRSMLDQVLQLFEISPDFDLDLMSDAQTLAGLSAKILIAFSEVLEQSRPDIVLVHGDTSTTSMATLACFYQRIAVGHVEAGLRTHNIWSPWPEEMNRRIVGHAASLHFAPTQNAADNLLAEGVAEKSVVLTGNTVIDALLDVVNKLESDAAVRAPLERKFSFLNADARLILVTGHRRENFGEGVKEICQALAQLSERENVEILYPVHLNPNIKKPVEDLLSGHPNIHLIEPQDYLSFVYLMSRSTLILTDSGGIQEEAPSLGVPVLVMRDNTERPEAVEAGTALLVGAKASRIVDAASRLLDDQAFYEAMSTTANPYGDGQAASRIVQELHNSD